MTCTLCPPGYQHIEDLAEHDRIWHGGVTATELQTEGHLVARDPRLA